MQLIAGKTFITINKMEYNARKNFHERCLKMAKLRLALLDHLGLDVAYSNEHSSLPQDESQIETCAKKWSKNNDKGGYFYSINRDRTKLDATRPIPEFTPVVPVISISNKQLSQMQFAVEVGDENNIRSTNGG